MNKRTRVIMAGLGILICLISFLFYDAAGDVINPQDVIWGLGQYFRDIDRSDIILMQRIGLFGLVIGGSVLLFGLVLMVWRND